MGAWLAGIILVLAAGHNTSLIDDLVRKPPVDASKVLVKLSQDEGRVLLRHFAAETDRRLRRQWEIVEICLGLTILISLFLGTSGKRLPGTLCLLMLGCVCFLHWFVRPEMVKLAPGIDFVLDAQASVARERYRSLSSAYTTAVYVKLVLGFVAAYGLMKRGRRRVPTDAV